LLAFSVTLVSLPVRAEQQAARSDSPSDPRREARQLATSESELSQRDKILIERPDRSRPEHPFSVSAFGRPLTLGGRYTFLTRYDRNKMLDFDFFDSDNKDVDGDGDVDENEDEARGDVPRDDQVRVNQALQADLFYPFAEDASIYAEFRVFWRNLVWSESLQTKNEWLFARGEFWLYLGNLFGSPMGLQVGRQNYFDDREWWWDQELDSLRLRLDWPQVHAEIAVAQELFPVIVNRDSIDPEQKDVLQILAGAQWSWARKHRVGLYALHRRDHSSQQPIFVPPPAPEPNPDLPCVAEEDFPPNLPEEAKEFFRSGCPEDPPPPPPAGFQDESDTNLTWIGVSAGGTWRARGLGRFHYWLEAAGVFGKERFTDYSGPTETQIVETIGNHRVSGAGLDVGGTWEMPSVWHPSFTLGYAYGSGKAGSSEARDTGFRQTGMQDNNDKFRGVASFRYYGELFDPELSNLQILTAGFGIRFFERSSIDFVYHNYKQAVAAPFFHDVDFKRDPDGLSRDIGQEWDLIVGVEDLMPVEFKLVGSIFQPGDAFGPEKRDPSYLVSLRMRVNF